VKDLITFLRARLDEDERIARDADGITRDTTLELYEDLIRSRPLDDQRTVYGIFISHFTSGKALTDIFGKRQILDEAERIWNSDADGIFGAGMAIAQMLALPYAGHHEYRKEWLP
jgi:hypothetical protein